MGTICQSFELEIENFAVEYSVGSSKLNLEAGVAIRGRSASLGVACRSAVALHGREMGSLRSWNGPFVEGRRRSTAPYGMWLCTHTPI